MDFLFKFNFMQHLFKCHAYAMSTLNKMLYSYILSSEMMLKPVEMMSKHIEMMLKLVEMMSKHIDMMFKPVEIFKNLQCMHIFCVLNAYFMNI